MQRFALLDEHGIVLATVVYHTTVPMVPDHVPHERIGLYENAPIGSPLGTPLVIDGQIPEVLAPEPKVIVPVAQVEPELPKVAPKRRWWRRK